MGIQEHRIVQLSDDGNLTIPNDFLRNHNWKPGQNIEISSKGNEIKLILADQARDSDDGAKQFFGMFKGMENDFKRDRPARDSDE